MLLDRAQCGAELRRGLWLCGGEQRGQARSWTLVKKIANFSPSGVRWCCARRDDHAGSGTCQGSAGRARPRRSRCARPAGPATPSRLTQPASRQRSAAWGPSGASARWSCTSCTAVPPEAVFTMRTYAATSPPYDPEFVRDSTCRNRQPLRSAPCGITQDRNVAQDIPRSAAGSSWLAGSMPGSSSRAVFCAARGRPACAGVGLARCSHAVPVNRRAARPAERV